MRIEHGAQRRHGPGAPDPRVTSVARSNQACDCKQVLATHPFLRGAGSAYEGANFLACARTLFSYSTLFWQ